MKYQPPFLTISFKKNILLTNIFFFGKYDKNNNLIFLLTLYVNDILIKGIDNEIKKKCY